MPVPIEQPSKYQSNYKTEGVGNHDSCLGRGAPPAWEDLRRNCVEERQNSKVYTCDGHSSDKHGEVVGSRSDGTADSAKDAG